MKTLLHLTDFSEAADKALEQTKRLAQLFGANVHILHKVVYPPPHTPTEVLDHLGDAAKFDYVLEEVLERPEREAMSGLNERATALRDAGVNVTEHLVRSGDVFDAVEEAIRHVRPNLLVMGTHGRSAIGKWLMGSVAEKVLRHTSCDVLMLHADSKVAGAEQQGLGEILVATDFSDCSRRALRAARDLAANGRGTLCLLHVVEVPVIPFHEEFQRSVADSVDRARYETFLMEELRDPKGAVLVAEGNVSEEIERVAKERDAAMVVIGTHGRSGLQRALIGSVAERVSRLCHRPVMTVR
jgi:nucleotide-binding universal stress UspA family protein